MSRIDLTQSLVRLAALCGLAAILAVVPRHAAMAQQSADGLAIARQAVEAIVHLLNPFAPHITEELWEALGHGEPLHATAWPGYDADLAKEDEIELVLQVNGKVRGRVVVPADTAQGELEGVALADPTVQKWLDGKPPRKVIVVPGRLVNVVV